ncbi:hypothetical protein LCGC14_2984580, partial [marine sediment metagenome]
LKDQKQPDEAIGAYREALRIRPDFVEARFNLGNLFKMQGLLPEALEAFEIVVDQRPDFAKAHYHLGGVLKSQGQAGRALAEYEKAVRLKPAYFDPHLAMANLRRDAGQGPFTGEAVGELLDEVGWPAGDRALDAGISEMGTWYLDGEEGLAALSALVDEELGFVYVNKMGSLVFEGRDHRYKTDHLTSQATYTDNPTGARRYDRFDPYTLGIEHIYNKAAATTHPRKAPANETFSMGIPEDSGGNAVPPQLAPGEVRTFSITWGNPASSLVSTSVTANSAADGSGTDLSSDIAKVNGTLRATRIDIQLTNNTSKPQTAYITALSAVVKTRQDDGQGMELEAEDSGSQGDYGVRRLGAGPAFIEKTSNA